MKTIRNLFASIFAILLFATATYAGNTSTTNTEELRKEIKKSLQEYDLANYDFSDDIIKVQFIINDKRELVVLRTDSDELDEVIKFALNYKELESYNSELKRNSLYSIKIKLEKK